MDTWILQMCRAKYRNQVIAWGLTAALGIAIAFGNTRYIGNFLRGPFDAGAADLAQIGDAATAPHYFVKVAGSKATDMGLQEVSVETENGVEKSRTVTSTFYMLQVGNKLLVVKSKGAVTREAPLILHAAVDRDDGERGLVLRFYDLSAELSRYLDYVIHALPLVIDDDDDEGCLVTELLDAS